MSKRVGGFINQDGLNAPDQATSVSASAGDEQATVSFTPPTDVGGSAITGFRAQSNDGIGASASASPITVTGLTNDTAYTFRVWALNAFGLSSPSDASGSVTPAVPVGAFAGGGTPGTEGNTIDFVSINTTGNASDFGDLTVSVRLAGGAGTNTRGFFAGGASTANVIGQITWASAGNAVDFGDLTTPRIGVAGCGSATRCVFAGDFDSVGSNVMDFITAASAGNATDFGDMTSARGSLAACSSSTRGIFAGGFVSGSGTRFSSIDKITIASTGNAASFGNLSAPNADFSGCASATRGVFFGGSGTDGTSINTIEFITLSTDGNATDFGDLLGVTQQLAACSSTTRGLSAGGVGVFAGGFTANNVISFVTIASVGNATDFGDLTLARTSLTGTSNAHGGLS